MLVQLLKLEEPLVLPLVLLPHLLPELRTTSTRRIRHPSRGRGDSLLPKCLLTSVYIKNTRKTIPLQEMHR
jgi:hypothetical protein